jgi:hypothetical protein
MDIFRSFETTLAKLSSYIPAEFAKTRTGNLTIFMVPRLPYYFIRSSCRKSRRGEGNGRRHSKQNINPPKSAA